MLTKIEMKSLIRKARIAKAFGEPGIEHICNTTESVAKNMISMIEYYKAGEITYKEYMAQRENTICIIALLESYTMHYLAAKNSGFI